MQTQLLPQELIAIKRDGGHLNAEQISAFVQGLSDGSVGDAQAGAFAMAVFLNDMNREERVALTLAMRDSGRVMNWDLPGPVVDKHSTGGVGDKVSLILAPLAAACGAFVPMISGRGLGHTGGTMDKMAAIPGYDVEPDPARFAQVVRQVGCAIIGQTGDLAPADKRLYAIRDISGTVESVPLITASILSKKLAAGLDGLIMDVKVGSGAFMKDLNQAEALASALISVGEGAGCGMRAVFSDMDQVLGRTAGNILEVREAQALLNGTADLPRLRDICIELVADMLRVGGLEKDLDAARTRVATKLDSGAAAEVYERMVAALGGPNDVLSEPFSELDAPHILPLLAPEAGTVRAIDTYAVGMAVVGLGGGRRLPSDMIDPRVGLSEIVGLGETLAKGDPLLQIHAATESEAEAARARLSEAFTLGAALEPSPLVRKRMSIEDLAD